MSETIWGPVLMAYRKGNMKARIVFDPKYTPARTGKIRLFDLAADPGEMHPIRARSAATDAFLLEAQAEVTRRWTVASRAAGVEPAAPKNGPKGATDEALEKLRALGYLR